MPCSHATHCKSLVVVATTSIRVPGSHAARTGVHSLSLSSPEKLTPCTHAAHSRFAVAEPALDMPWPAGHVAHAVQELLLLDAEKWPAGHASHCRSEVAVAAALMNVPGSHTARTSAQAAPSFVAENVLPAMHGAHVRSATAEPSVAMPWPAGQVVHAVHLSRPAEAVKEPSAHASHTRSLLAVAAATMRVPAGHGVRTAEHEPVP